MTLTLLKGERAIDGLRWVAAFAAVVLFYGVAGWMLLRPTGWQLGVNAPVVEVDLSDMPQLSALPPSDRAAEPASPANRGGADAASDLPGSADDHPGSTAERAVGGLASRTDAGLAARKPDTADARDGPADAEKASALEQPDRITPGARADALPEALPLPPPYPPPHDGQGREGADSGAGGRLTAAPPRVVTPDTSTAASIARAPIDTSITVNQGRSLLRSAKGGPQFRGALPPQLRLTLPLTTPKDGNALFSRKSSPIAGSMLLAPGPTAPAANYGRAPDPAQRPGMGTGGGLAHNAIGAVIEQHAVVPHAGAPLGIHPLPGTMSAAVHASGERSAATTAPGALLGGRNTTPNDTGLSPAAASRSQAGRPDQASQVASIGGPAINGAGIARPASSTGSVGGPAKIAAGALNGSGFRPKYR